MALSPSPTDATKPVRGRPGHLHGLDWLRVLCTLAVVAIHTLATAPVLTPLWQSLSFAVPCFVMMSLVLTLPKLVERGLGGRLEVLGQRTVRLAVPYLVWTAVFLGLRLGWGSLRPTVSVLTASVFFGGAAMHLYFVPLLVVFTGLCSLLPRHVPVRVAIGVVGVTVSLWLQQTRWPWLPFGTPEAASFPHYVQFELPFLFSGILFAAGWPVLGAALGRHPRRAALFAAALLVLAVGGLARPAGLLPAVPNHVVFWLATCLLFAGFLALGLPCPRPLRDFGGVSFGVFFCHPLFVEGCRRMESGLRLESASLVVTCARFLLVLTASTVLAFVLGLFPRTRFLVR